MKECEQCYNHMRDIWAFKRRDKSQDQLPIKIFTGIEAVDEAILNRNDSFSERYNRAMNLLKYVDVSD